MEEETVVYAEERIISGLKDGELFDDGEFLPSDDSLYNVRFGWPAALISLQSFDAIPDYAQQEPRTSSGSHPWQRPEDINDAYAIMSNDELERSFIRPGQLPDSWLLGAMACVGVVPGLLENLFPVELEVLKQYGLCTVRLYKEGEWHDIVVDTRLPCGSLDPGSVHFGPIYGRNPSTELMWVALMEKAYAKLHGGYENLSDGSTAEALVDLTGGVAEVIDLMEPKVVELEESGRLWEKLLNYVEWGYILGASFAPSRGGEEDGVTLLKNHTYPILHIKQVRDLRFVKLFCPWGVDAAWTGNWSDDWPEWLENPDIEAALKDDIKCKFDRETKDGTFWMVWEDFVGQFNRIYMCRSFNDTFNQYLINGAWDKSSAGGSHKDVKPEELSMNVVKETDSSPCKYADGDSSWFLNPQYKISVATETDVCVSLMQRDFRTPATFQRRAAADWISFSVLEANFANKGRMWHRYPSLLVGDSMDANFSRSDNPTREVVKAKVRLVPGKSYVVVPCTKSPGVFTSYVLRLFSQSAVDIRPIQPLQIQVMDGCWEYTGRRDSAGGAPRVSDKFNPRWAQNPQYHITVPSDLLQKATLVHEGKSHVPFLRRKLSLTIVLKRIAAPGGANASTRKDARPSRLGLAVLKGAHKEGSPRMVTGSAKPSRSEEAVSQPEEDVVPDKKLQLLQHEWSQQSLYKDRTFARTTLLQVPLRFMEDGLIVVPSLAHPGQEGSFSLTVFSDEPLSIRELPESRQKTLAGEWDEATAKGSHLYADWKQNPRYLLRLKTDRAASVKITLSRPEERWSVNVAKDSVGCMIGFYLIPGNSIQRNCGGIYHEGKAWNETQFVPMHEVSTPEGLLLDPLPEGETYTIVPATFERGKVGPFNITVTASCRFSVRKQHR